MITTRDMRVHRTDVNLQCLTLNPTRNHIQQRLKLASQLRSGYPTNSDVASQSYYSMGGQFIFPKATPMSSQRFKFILSRTEFSLSMWSSTPVLVHAAPWKNNLPTLQGVINIKIKCQKLQILLISSN